LGLAVLAWSPLAGGRLAADAGPVGAALDAAAARLGVSRTVAAYAWILQHPARPIPLVGSQRPERIREAASAVGTVLARADWYAVLAAARGAPLP
jgi:predicted oxidoreductase